MHSKYTLGDFLPIQLVSVLPTLVNFLVSPVGETYNQNQQVEIASYKLLLHVFPHSLHIICSIKRPLPWRSNPFH